MGAVHVTPDGTGPHAAPRPVTQWNVERGGVPPVIITFEAGSGPLLVTVAWKYWYPVTWAMERVATLTARSADPALLATAAGWEVLSLASAVDDVEATIATRVSSVARMMSLSETEMHGGWDMLFSVWCTDPRSRLREGGCRMIENWRVGDSGGSRVLLLVGDGSGPA